MLQSMVTMLMSMLGNALVYQGMQLVAIDLISVAICMYFLGWVRHAVLLFFIENHVNDEGLPSELSKKSNPWLGINQQHSRMCMEYEVCEIKPW